MGSTPSPKHTRSEDENRIFARILPAITEPATGRTILQTRIVAGKTNNATLQGDLDSQNPYGEQFPDIDRYIITGHAGFSNRSDANLLGEYVEGELNGVVEINS